MKPVFTLLCFSITALNASAQYGAPDPDFGGGDGIVITSFVEDYNESAHAVLIQPDGNIVAAGQTDGFGFADLALARYFPDGTPDLTFGVHGKVVNDIGERDFIVSMVLQPDMKILVAGHVEYSTHVIGHITRYLPNGDPDPGFGTGGTIVTPGFYIHEYFNNISLQDDGKILALGWFSTGSAIFPSVYRFLPDGTPDSSFAVNGKWTDSTQFALWNNIRFLSGGKILLGGTTNTLMTPDANFALKRLNPDGTIDSTFNVDGQAELVSPDANELSHMDIQSDGKIVVAGTTYNATSWRFSVGRFNSDGSVDAGFGSGGLATFLHPTNYAGAHSVAVQPDGKLVVSGRAHYFSQMHFALVCFNADGTIDNTFGLNGRQETILTQAEYYDEAFASAMQPDGKLVVAGMSMEKDYSNFGLVRYDMTLMHDLSGLSETVSNTFTSVYPNPVSDMLNISVAVDDAHLKLMNLDGQTVMEQDLHAQGAKLDLSAQPSGVYLLEINSKTAVEHVRVIKE